ncbi:MAG TPA: GlxA family transcriptional regulator [Acetobacteraceae bacterium]|nr:GlxA family transcriptional regulator [Acetobacteraceae bacterium]
MPTCDPAAPHDDISPATIGFLLVPGFALLPYACAVEPLRAANVLSGRALYAWQHFSPDGAPAAASNGIVIAADPLSVDPTPNLRTLFVCAGGNPATFEHEATFARLRRLARQGLTLGGISGGAYILARAGLLENRRFTLHWEHAAAFAEEFPALDLRRSLFEIDRDRLTCSGGTAALDMMHALIARAHGPSVAAAVSDWFLQTEIRAGATPQRLSLRERLGVRSGPLLRALAAMEERLENPHTRLDLAAAAGVTPRQLERLFRRELGRTPGAHYLLLRLERARQLARQTGLPLAEIAAACGFASLSHFSRSYRARFGAPPATERFRRRRKSSR